jgi:hypothetical protein
MQPVLTMCAANATVQTDPAGNRKLSKIKSHGRIDGMVALAMAMSVAGTYEAEEISVFELLAKQTPADPLQSDDIDRWSSAIHRIPCGKRCGNATNAGFCRMRISDVRPELCSMGRDYYRDSHRHADGFAHWHLAGK